MPLPEAWGENCRTNQAANRVATAHAPTTIRNPQIVWPWAQVIVVARRRSAETSESRKTAPTHPVAAPTIKAVAASPTGRDVRRRFVDGRLYGLGLVCRSFREPSTAHSSPSDRSRFAINPQAVVCRTGRIQRIVCWPCSAINEANRRELRMEAK
jgi:hypothetical protein